MGRGSSRDDSGAPGCPALDAASFGVLMQPLGPFEPAPRLAVGLSGGADSLALALLLRDWVRARGGSLTALTVDHGLRPDSAAEARAVGRQAKALDIDHRLLRWRGARPGGNLQAEARQARRGLLLDWCEAAGVLHLALGHQRDDQAETLLLNLARGSGLDGLAGMSPLSETAQARVLRPLLTVPRARLEALLRDRELAWVEDPSNRDPRFGRARLRGALPLLAEALTPEALMPEALAPEVAAGADEASPAGRPDGDGTGRLGRRMAEAAGHLARTRAARDGEVAALLARVARLDPAGFLLLDACVLGDAAEEVGLRALARILTTLGGRDYPPRFEPLRALYLQMTGRQMTGPALPAFAGATLGGCRLAPRRGGILVTREGRGIETLGGAAGAPLAPAGLWDGRYRYRLARGAGEEWRLGPLGWAGRGGRAGRESLAGLEMASAKAARGGPLPAAARETLPAFFDAKGLLAVPQLGIYRDSAVREAIRLCRFAPGLGLTGAGFTVA